jgi:hypothetical protein
LAIMPGGMLGGPALFNGLPSLFTVQWGATNPFHYPKKSA